MVPKRLVPVICYLETMSWWARIRDLTLRFWPIQFGSKVIKIFEVHKNKVHCELSCSGLFCFELNLTLDSVFTTSVRFYHFSGCSLRGSRCSRGWFFLKCYFKFASPSARTEVTSLIIPAGSLAGAFMHQSAGAV